MTVISRIEVDHPTLGTAGGSALHAQIAAIYQKLGDNINTRFFYVSALANSATADVDHNFRVPLSGLRYDVYAWDTGTQELTLLTSSTTPTRAQIPVTATPGFTTTQSRLTNNSGATRDLVIAMFQDPIELDELTDVELTSPSDGQALTYEASSQKWKNTTPNTSAAVTVSGETIDVSTGTLFHCTMLADKNFSFTNMIAGKAITVILASGDAKSYLASFTAGKSGQKSNVHLVSSGRMMVLNFKFSSSSKSYSDDVPRESFSEAGFSKLAFGDQDDGNVYASCIYNNHLYIGGSFSYVENNGPVNAAVAFNRKTGERTNLCIGKFGSNAADGSISAIVVADGYAYLGGSFTHYDGLAVNNLVRIDLKTGNVDTTFAVSALNGGVYALAIDDTGLYVGGDFTTYNGNTRNRILKLSLTDASDLHATFAAGTGFNDTVSALVIGNSARLTVGGQFTTYQGNTRNRIAQLNTTTAADNNGTFAASTGFNNPVRVLAYDNGNLWVGGEFTTYIGNTRNRIARISETTAADQNATFAAGTGFNGTVRALAYDSGQTLLYIGGEFTTYNGNTRTRIVAVNGTTAADQNATFLANEGFNSTVYGLTFDVTSGAVFAAGGFTTYKNRQISRLVKIFSDGSVDLSFKASGRDPQGIGGLGDVLCVAIDQTFGELVIVGGGISFANLETGYAKLVKVNLDTMEVCQRFRVQSNGGRGFTANQQINALAADASGLYVGGTFGNFQGKTRGRLVKLNLETGVEDATFSTGTGFNGDVNALVLDATGLFVGGSFSTYNGNTRNRIAKLDPTTGADQHATFAASTGFNSTVESLALDSSYLYVGGNFTTYIGNTRNGIAKLDKTTAADQHATFAAGTGFNGTVVALALNGGFLYVGGSFSTYKGNNRNNIAKLDATTAADQHATFAASTGFDTTVLALATDGTYLWVGGLFTTYIGNTRNGIIKLNATTAADQNATFDATVGFNCPSGAATPDVEMLLLNGTTLFAGGVFTWYRNRPSRGFTKLLANDGTILRDTLT